MVGFFSLLHRRIIADEQPGFVGLMACTSCLKGDTNTRSKWVLVGTHHQQNPWPVVRHDIHGAGTCMALARSWARLTCFSCKHPGISCSRGQHLAVVARHHFEGLELSFLKILLLLEFLLLSLGQDASLDGCEQSTSRDLDCIQMHSTWAACSARAS